MSEPWAGECLSIPQAAKATGIGKDKIREWVDSGQLPKANTPGIKHVRIRRCDLLEFLAPKTVENRLSSTKSDDVAA